MRILSLTASTLLLLLCLLPHPNAMAEMADRIVAVVNDDIITLSELNEEGSPYFQALIKQAPADQLQREMQKLRKEVLSHLIDQRLIDQQATLLEIKVTDEDVDQSITTLLTENHVTREEYLQDLAAKGISEEQYRKQMKSQILQSRLVNREIRSKLVVTDDKVNQYYRDNYTPGATGAVSGYHLLQMGFLWGEEYKQKTADEAKAAAESAKKLLDNGKSFQEVAKEFSDLPSKEDGGDIGVFKQEELAAFMKDTVLAMKPGETSAIIEAPNGYELLKLVSAPGDDGKDKTKAQATPPPEIKKEIETKLFREEGEKMFNKWITELRTKAFIKENL